jgi:AraC-like DNA-binding protein/mannose-6-phosphate isomerase-like protein (cupin superfamily)
MKAHFEAIAPSQTTSLNAFLQEKKEFDYPFHYHPEYELTFIISSRGIRYVGNHFGDFRENDLVFLGPDLPHCWKNAEGQADPAAAIVIQWGENLLGEGWIDSKEFKAIKKLHLLAQKGIKFTEAVALEVKDRLLYAVTLPPFQKLIAVLQLLNELAQTNQYELLCEQGFSYNLNLLENERINTVYQYLRMNYSKKITLENVASEVSMTEESFSRFFSKVMKKTFFGFVNEYRINVACNLLIKTDMNVNQIGYAAGYESFPFFYRQFKKFKSCSPQKYRTAFQKTGNISIP